MIPAKAPKVPSDIVLRLRDACMALPEVREEAAWIGTRWCIRKHTFAHVLMLNDGKPAAFAKAAGTPGPLCVLTFRSPLPELDAYAFTWAPFFRPIWFKDIVGMRLDGDTDWDEVEGLLRASWRYQAPRKLADSLGAA